MEHHLDQLPSDPAERIRLLNRKYRRSVPHSPDLMITSSAQNVLGDFLSELFVAIRDFDDFNEDNDPHGEEDFGCVKVRGREFWWKIDYYDMSLEWGSSDPSDPALTRRVMTVFLPEEY